MEKLAEHIVRSDSGVVTNYEQTSWGTVASSPMALTAR
jgi:hypothetical protein